VQIPISSTLKVDDEAWINFQANPLISFESERNFDPYSFTPTHPTRYFPNLLHGNAAREPGERGRDGAGLVA
jgi:hypothetical protein